MWSGHQKENKKTGYIVKVVFFSYCAKHNLRMLMLGGSGACPQENFEK